jgi:hypothetical protein
MEAVCEENEDLAQAFSELASYCFKDNDQARGYAYQNVSPPTNPDVGHLG